MNTSEGGLPDLAQLRGVVAPEIRTAAQIILESPTRQENLNICDVTYYDQ
jgi:hypothetical protein